MNKIEMEVMETLREWAREATVPSDLAAKAITSRRRTPMRTLALAGAATIVAAVVLIVTVLTPTTPRPAPIPFTDQGDPANSPPKTLVAAGQVAMSAYTTWKRERITKKKVLHRTTWHLYNPRSGRYESTKWAFVDIAPGLGHAAVLEGELPARRVGLLDLRSGTVTRWIQLERQAGAAVFSPDGRKLLVTYYDGNPDKEIGWFRGDTYMSDELTDRTGFQIVDVATGEAEEFRPFAYECSDVPPCLDKSGRRDIRWSRDGALIRDDEARFYTTAGKPAKSPPHEDEMVQAAGLSPNGRLVAVAGKPPGPQTTVVDVRTGRTVGTQPMLQLAAWADNKRLIAWDCGKGCRSEHRARLSLVNLDGETIKPLTGFRKPYPKSIKQVFMGDGRWEPVFTRR